MHMHINSGSPFDTVESAVSSAQLEKLQEIAAYAGIEKMFGCPFAACLNPEVVEEQNAYMRQIVQKTGNLYQWVVIEPRLNGTIKQADVILRDEKCVGIKLHPLYHQYALDQYADVIFPIARKHGKPVLIHAEKEPTYIVPMADRYPDVQFIIAHMGDVPYVDAVAQAKHGNIWLDTSGIASSKNQVIEYAVSRIGADRILFGTDTYAAGFQRGRVAYAGISLNDKAKILRFNAQCLFGKH